MSPPAVTRGVCQKMCPPAEIQFRIQNNLVHILECSADGLGGKQLPNPQKMVKEFSRSAAGADLVVAEQLRPAPVLSESVDYLIKLFHQKKNGSLGVVYNFVLDRLRAVRQDMVIQQLNSADTLTLLEKMMPFYVETEYTCNTTTANFYNWKLHSTQMEDCFSTWNACLSKTAKFSQDILFISFFRHLNLIKMNSLLPFFTHENRRVALNLYNSFISTNFVKFFRLLSNLSSPLIKQSFASLVHHLRLKAIVTISVGFKFRNSSVSSCDIQRWLLFDTLEDSLIVLSEYFSIENSSVLISSFAHPPNTSPKVNLVLNKFNHLL